MTNTKSKHLLAVAALLAAALAMMLFYTARCPVYYIKLKYFTKGFFHAIT